MESLVWIIIIAICIGVYILRKQGKLTWLNWIKLPRILEPKADNLVDKLKLQTEREVEKAEELRGLLEAKRNLAEAKAENIKLKKEIDAVSEKNFKHRSSNVR